MAIGVADAFQSFQNLFMYGRALSADEVTRLYNGGGGFDPTI